MTQNTQMISRTFYQFTFVLPAEVQLQEIQFHRPFYAIKTLDDVILLRPCHKCKKLLALTEFYGRKSPCKCCHKQLCRDWQRRNPERVKLHKKACNWRYRVRQKLKNAGLE